MDFDSIFNAYYTQYRLEATIPASTEDEYIIAKRLANEALNRWAHYDNTYWKELFTTAVDSGEVGSTISGTSAYDAPEDFVEGGGNVRLLDSNGNVFSTYPILDPQDPQFKSTSSQYAYFTGSPVDGYVLNLNPTPGVSEAGKTIQYDYYKSPTLYTTGSDISEIPEPYFVVHRALANRFRGSRNPFYDDAKADAEDVLKTMQSTNNSGNWANPFVMSDRSSTVWGR